MARRRRFALPREAEGLARPDVADRLAGG